MLETEYTTANVRQYVLAWCELFDMLRYVRASNSYDSVAYACQEGCAQSV
jgi:hypothetical protein